MGKQESTQKYNRRELFFISGTNYLHTCDSYQSFLSWCWYPWQGWWWVFVLFFSKGLSYNRLLQILGGLTLLGNMCQPLRHVMKNDRMLSSGAEWIRLRGTAST